MRRLFLSAMLILLLCPRFGALTAAAQSDRALEIVQRVNAYRVSQGMPALPTNHALMLAAQRHADWQAANHTSSHQEFDGSMPNDRAAAAGYGGLALENVAAGTLGWATTAWSVEGWIGSYGHRQTMLSKATDIGAGVADDNERTFFVLLIGNTSGFMVQPSDGVPAARVADASPTVVEQGAVVVPIVIATPDANGTVTHVVRDGQTAWAIAARYGVSLDDLLALNHLTRPAVLHPGDSLVIQLGPGQSPPPPPTPVDTHVVAEGETIWAIAVQNGLTVDELLALNGLRRGAIVRPGDTLRLRAAESTPTSTPPDTATETAATIPAPALTATPTQPPTAVSPTSPPPPTVTPQATATLTPSPVSTATLLPSPTRAPSAVPASEADTRNTDTAVIFGAAAIALIGMLAVLGGVALMLHKRRS